MDSPERPILEITGMAKLSWLNSAIVREKAAENFEAVRILYRIRQILIRVYKLQDIEF